MKSLEEKIFKQGSTTYFWASAFFPRSVKEDVFRLYSFVRVIDDYIDVQHPDKAKIRGLYKTWQQCQKAGSVPRGVFEDHVVIGNMITLTKKYDFDGAWIEGFWESMFMDLDGHTYLKMADTIKYMYGSAEVIGLMMSKLIGIDAKAYEAACLQGRAMQYINFIRDIQEDITLGRNYFPVEERAKFGLDGKDFIAKAQQNPEAWQGFVRAQLDYYQQWQSEANEGMHYIPRRLRVPILTARDMYNWTAEQIYSNPQIVFSEKVKPSPVRVLLTGVKKSAHAR